MTNCQETYTAICALLILLALVVCLKQKVEILL